MAFRAALVDFDGTLADSMPFWLDLPRETLAEAGIPEPEGFDRLIRESPMREVAAVLSEAYPALAGEPPLAERWYARMAENYRRWVTLKPGARELLALFRAEGLKTAILSATRRPVLEIALERFALGELLDAVFTEDEMGSKRTEGCYLRCAEALGTAPEELLLVEDAPRNLAAGRRFGLGTVGVYDDSMAVWQEDVRRDAHVYLPDLTDREGLRAWLRREEEAKR